MQTVQKGQCCPKGSWPILQADYKPKGQTIKIGSFDCYHIGQGKRVVIMVSDIFGAFSSLHQSFADTFSSLGYKILIPEFLQPLYSGPVSRPQLMQYIKTQNYVQMLKRFKQTLQLIKTSYQVQRVFVIGFCWGVWLSFKLATQLDQIIAIGGMHPSLGLEQLFGGTQDQLTKQVKCPAWLFPAGNDPDNIKTNGSVINILKDKFGKNKIGTHQFPEMIHGWTVRGDIKDQKVRRDVKLAINLCHQYFTQFN